MTKKRQPRAARIIKAAVNAIAVQEAVQGCQTSHPAVAIQSSAVEETRNPTGVKELVSLKGTFQELFPITTSFFGMLIWRKQWCIEFAERKMLSFTQNYLVF